MKKLLISVAAITALSMGAAHAENTLVGNYYAGISAFWSSIPDSDVVYNATSSFSSPDRVHDEAEWDGSFGMSGFVGYKLWQGNNLRTRIEGEVGYHKLDLDKDSIDDALDIDGGSAWTFMANGYVDFPLQFGLTPYVGLGAGMALADIGGDKGNDTVFAWQAIVGASYSLTEFSEIFAEYRYLAFDDIEFSTDANDSGNFIEYASHNVGLGVRFHF